MKLGTARALFLILVFVCTLPGWPQASDASQQEIKNLIVSIRTKFGDKESAGAGIIFGLDDNQIYIVTANHVVREGDKDGQDLRVELAFLPGKQLPAKLLSHLDLKNDLAVLSVAGFNAYGVKASLLVFDQLGDPGVLSRGDPVFLLGHPNGVPWSLTVTPDGFIAADGDWLRFESKSLFPGHSGGALLNARLEIVGMLRSDAQPNGEALNINTILTQLKSWQYPVQLRQRFETTNLETLSAGAGHTCYVGAHDQAFCWGSNSDGELGNGTKADSAVPSPLAGGVSLVSVSAGHSHTCGVNASAVAFCWGANESGQLGDSTLESSSHPVQVAGGIRFAEVSAGLSHSCGLTTDGLAYCWGDNERGQLGISGKDSPTPVLVAGGLKFRSVRAGYLFTCGIAVGGAAYCWGSNAQGRLGNGSQKSSPVPVPVSSGLNFVSISPSATHACGVTTNGKGYCWGDNEHGQLGNGSHVSSSVPVPVSSGLIFQSISAGTTFSCGVTKAGIPHCWGWGNDTVTATEEEGPDDVPAPVFGSKGLVLKSVTTGQVHACALASAGQVYCWGANNYGQLGNGVKEDSVRPVLVPLQP
jgi:alpha-tubulin suppressor-like RCC1 family protein